MANVVHNPGIPYVAPIPGGIHDGMQIHVAGTPEHHHNGFLVSLQCGGSIDPRSECAFVFNPRFTENQVIRNSLQGGAWGAEERHGGFPFNRGHRCDVTIHVKSHCYSVSVNGRHFCDYNHRMQMHRVTHISVEQGIRVNTIRFEGKHVPYPGGGPSYPSSGAPIYNPPTPFTHNTGPLYPNKMIFISGIVNPNPSRMKFNLETGDSIAFHFDVRFKFGNDHHVIVRNTKQGNQWGHEERSLSYFPFQPNMFFELIILVEYDCFKIAVNNQHLVEFYHRIQPLNRINTLRVDGDVRLTQVRFQG
ncbi:lymphatic endothelial cell migration [Mactra antiquata]